jgi:hypothetical protein
MRSTGNFHPEWGYLAPSSNFIRTARTALIAVVVGGIAGAIVVLPLVERPAGERSLVARTLPRNDEVASVRVVTPGAAQTTPQAAVQDQPVSPAPTDGGRAGGAPSASSSTQSPTSVAAVPEVPAASASSAKSRSYRGPAPTQKKASRMPHPTSRYASRGEHAIGDGEPRRLFNYQPLFGANVPAEYYPRRGYSGYYREPRWGDYPYGGFDYR